jgi:hypothetical protein
MVTIPRTRQVDGGDGLGQPWRRCLPDAPTTGWARVTTVTTATLQVRASRINPATVTTVSAVTHP